MQQLYSLASQNALPTHNGRVTPSECILSQRADIRFWLILLDLALSKGIQVRDGLPPTAQYDPHSL